ncbi:putative pathway-specific regulatory protein nit-4 [Coleophoma crateriformis]|uniref:Putative pathway-specific regulatory protein nit-4 n=1 Tax=Coleophoma crateriformis TaxID=565419 RepID=A0A3D8S304_9HELO|nr:putative pathway-specific regulatory protein nit-4 [Coleophoma crateriformis]
MADIDADSMMRSGAGGNVVARLGAGGGGDEGQPSKKKSRSSRDAAAIKRRCVSTACIACRRRKSKCDGNTPSCAACSSVYGTECVYDPNSDHRRKGVYKEKLDSLKTRNSTLQTLVQAILNATEDEVPALVRQIRTCENLDDVADQIMREEQGIEEEEAENLELAYTTDLPTFETELSGKMGELRLENGSVRFLGGTSNLIYLPPTDEDEGNTDLEYLQQDDPLTSWTTVTKDTEVIVHLINIDFLLGKPPGTPRRTIYCSSLLVNAMLALGCHFTNSPRACSDPNDPTTKGDAFFAEAKRLIVDNDEYEKPRLVTIQALCLMSVREAGCGREAKGWVYSGMSFRMAMDMGLNLDSGGMTAHGRLNKDTMDEQEIDARRITFWGCFLFDKCWSNYLGRLPQLSTANITAPKYDVFPDEDADFWSPYTDNGVSQLHSQPSRTRTIALQISSLCEISSDLLVFFYHPQHIEKSVGKSQELKRLSELQTRLEAWRKDLPTELEPKEGQLPNVLLMHMFFNLLYIHLFRPFLKYSPSTSPLPSHVSPRKLCTHASGAISKLMRLYKRTYGLRQICNIAVYIVHSACTIHLLNLPEKTAKRDIIHGVKHLEEIAEDWLCARRTLSIISVLARKWKIDLPEEASTVLARTDVKFGFFSTADVPSPKPELVVATPPSIIRSPPQVRPQPLPVTQDSNQLRKSLYSYLPDTTSNIQDSSPITQFTTQTLNQNAPQSMQQGLGSLNATNLMQMPSIPYPSVPTYAASTLPRSDSGTTTSSSNTLTRHVSPSNMFGGVDALVESQDWWLRDQASLAMGFDNWMGGDQNGSNTSGVPGLLNNGNGNPPGPAVNENGSGVSVGTLAENGGFYMGANENGKRESGFSDDEWYN